MTITAKYPGTCVLCGERFAAGETIEWSRGSGSAHAVCPPAPEQTGPIGHVEARSVTVTQPGVFENAAGIFVVKWNKDKTRLYAKRLVESAERSLEAGGRASFDFEYERGAIFDLTDTDRMPVERAKELAVRYGRCINCGRRLKAAASVEAGIGPVCIKRFGPVVNDDRTYPSVEPGPITDEGDMLSRDPEITRGIAMANHIRDARMVGGEAYAMAEELAWELRDPSY
jgi:hypothetical protein